MNTSTWRGCLPMAVGLALLSASRVIGAEEALRLQERFPSGYQVHVSTRVNLAGSLVLPATKDKAAQTLPVRGHSAIDYDERVLSVTADGQVTRTLRVYQRMDFHRTVGDKPQETSLRPAVRRLVLLRHKQTEVPFSPDGPLTWGEIDQVRTDVFTPALAGLLPDHAVRPGERWNATTAAVQELTDLDPITAGGIECRLEQVTVLENRRHARVAFTGSVRGTNEDGPNRQQLEGYFFFDLESNHLSYLSLRGRHYLLDGNDKEVGRVDGRFVLTRQVRRHCPALSDEALRGVSLEPNADNTRLLYDNPDLGIRFLYPRRWKVAEVRSKQNQVMLDGADGSGLLLTVEPSARVPTGAQFLDESRAWLQKQKVAIRRQEAPRQVRAEPALEHFVLETVMGGQNVVLDYYVTRQRLGGVTVAARLLPRDRTALQNEVARIARSITVTREK